MRVRKRESRIQQVLPIASEALLPNAGFTNENISDSITHRTRLLMPMSHLEKRTGLWYDEFMEKKPYARSSGDFIFPNPMYRNEKFIDRMCFYASRPSQFKLPFIQQQKQQFFSQFLKSLLQQQPEFFVQFFQPFIRQLLQKQPEQPQFKHSSAFFA